MSNQPTDPTPEDIGTETEAMRQLAAILTPLTPQQRCHVLEWVRGRFEIAKPTRGTVIERGQVSGQQVAAALNEYQRHIGRPIT